MFIKVVDTIVTQEIEPEEVKTPLKEYNDKATDRVVLSKVDQQLTKVDLKSQTKVN